MKPLELVKPGDRIGSASRENELREAINYLLKVVQTPGIDIRETSAGRSYSQRPVTILNKIPSLSGGELKELLQTQGTADIDTWDRITDKKPVSLQVITDIEYSNTTHKITCRLRTLIFDRGGNLKSISEESDPVDITTAIACTAQLT